MSDKNQSSDMFPFFAPFLLAPGRFLESDKRLL
jgi:hypothetical protein